MPGKSNSTDFQDRARFEAARYGSDPWVFVRELLQNARDAGATRVAFRTEATQGGVRLSCRDDGHGMGFEHARRYLFRLYASSKEREAASAGRFGVGFWAILRFEPARILIRSWPRHGRAWEVVLDGDLSQIARGTPPVAGPRGTEVVLERPGIDDTIPRRVFEAAWQAGRFLEQRDHPGRPLGVAVNGRSVHAPFQLPAPSASFRRGRLRGVVSLGRAASVELFSKGLRVRSAACLRDLLSATERSSPAPGPAPLAEGLAPRALLESADLELLLARADARDDRALRRLVRLAQRELNRLIARQLDCLRPRPWWSRGQRPRTWAAALLLLASGVATGLAIGTCSRPQPPPAAVASRARPDPRAQASPAGGTPVPTGTAGYLDLAERYPGPRMQAAGWSFAPLSLRYSPESRRLHLAALVIHRLDPLGRVAPALRSLGLTSQPYAGVSCESDCVDFQLAAPAGRRPVRLPVPTGHRLDPASVRVGGRLLAVHASPADEPVIRLPGQGTTTIHYRTGPASPPEARLVPDAPPLPATAARVAAALRERPREARAPAALAWVRGAIEYSDAPDVIARHRGAEAAGVPFVERSLAIGAGDCDIQNGVLTLLLQAAGVPARLAVGYLGEEGAVAPWLHAWVEVRDGRGPWRVADASEEAAPAQRPGAVAAPLTAARTPAPPEELVRRSTVWFPRSWPAALAVVAFLATAAGLVLARRTRRTLRLDRSADLTRLLQGALQHPEAFGAASEVFHRRLVPLARRGALSLAQAWDLATRGELCSTGARSALAARAIRRGWPVVDAGRPEGRVVAEALGAIDLDDWDRLLARSGSTPLLDAVNAHLRAQGERWLARIAGGIAAPTVIRLPGPRRESRVVIVDENLPWLVGAIARARSRPAEATFTVTDRLLALLDLPAPRQAQILAPLARAALLEAGRW